jgi:hypothetical protein
MAQNNISGGGDKLKKIMIAIPAVLCVTILAAIIWVSNPGPGLPKKFLAIGASRIYYTEIITADEAGRLGGFLEQVGYISDKRAGDFKLDRDQKGYIVSIVLSNRGVLKDPEYARTMNIVAQGMSLGVFNKQNTRIWACDRGFRKLAEFPR